MKKILSLILVFSILISSFISVSAMNSPKGISNYSEKNVKVDGVTKTVIKFNYNGKNVHYENLKLSKNKEKYIIKEGEKTDIIIYDKKEDLFIINGEPMKVDYNIRTVVEEPYKEEPNSDISISSTSYSDPPYGSEHDYTYDSTSYIDLRIEKTLGTISVNALAVVIALKCKTSYGIAYTIATATLATVGIWTDSNALFCIRWNYKHDIIPSEWKFIASYYYDSDYEYNSHTEKWFVSGLSAL